MIPPPRAEILGMKGANIKSTITRAYDKPNVDLPTRIIRWYAIRDPNPVLIKPLERKNANTTSHIILSLNPDRLSAKDRVCVKTHAAILIRATAPIGNGFKISAAIVVMNITKICHALGVRPSGTCIFHIMAAAQKRNNIVRFFFQICVCVI